MRGREIGRCHFIIMLTRTARSKEKDQEKEAKGPLKERLCLWNLRKRKNLLKSRAKIFTTGMSFTGGFRI